MKDKQAVRFITLCGSTKFKKEFQEANKELTLQGCVVYSVAMFGHADCVALTTKQKELLDKVHKRKIDNSNEIFVINVGGYIGSSTKSEIEYAKKAGKIINYLDDKRSDIMAEEAHGIGIHGDI